MRKAIQDTEIDSEAIETAFDALISVFVDFQGTASARTALRILVPGKSFLVFDRIDDPPNLPRLFIQASSKLKSDYSGLHPLDQREVERALTRLVTRRRTSPTAVEICTLIAGALNRRPARLINSRMNDLIIDYVEAVALTWRSHGIRPARAAQDSKPDYRSRFHRFADLVLTHAFEPWARRHDGDLSVIKGKIYALHSKLPKDLRAKTSGGLPRVDVELLVGDDHVKKALARIKKSTGKTP